MRADPFDEPSLTPSAPRDRVMENLQASKILPAEIGIQKRENVNLFMRAMGLDVDLLG